MSSTAPISIHDWSDDDNDSPMTAPRKPSPSSSSASKAERKSTAAKRDDANRMSQDLSDDEDESVPVPKAAAVPKSSAGTPEKKQKKKRDRALSTSDSDGEDEPVPAPKVAAVPKKKSSAGTPVKKQKKKKERTSSTSDVEDVNMDPVSDDDGDYAPPPPQSDSEDDEMVDVVEPSLVSDNPDLAKEVKVDGRRISYARTNYYLLHEGKPIEAPHDFTHPHKHNLGSGMWDRIMTNPENPEGAPRMDVLYQYTREEGDAYSFTLNVVWVVDSDGVKKSYPLPHGVISKIGKRVVGKLRNRLRREWAKDRRRGKVTLTDVLHFIKNDERLLCENRRKDRAGNIVPILPDVFYWRSRHHQLGEEPHPHLPLRYVKRFFKDPKKRHHDEVYTVDDEDDELVLPSKRGRWSSSPAQAPRGPARRKPITKGKGKAQLRPVFDDKMVVWPSPASARGRALMAKFRPPVDAMVTQMLDASNAVSGNFARGIETSTDAVERFRNFGWPAHVGVREILKGGASASDYRRALACVLMYSGGALHHAVDKVCQEAMEVDDDKEGDAEDEEGDACSSLW